MTTRQISIVIHSDGTSTLETHGMAGPGCQATSRFLEQALGRPLRESLKSEYYQSGRLTQTRTCRQFGSAGQAEHMG